MAPLSTQLSVREETLINDREGYEKKATLHQRGARSSLVCQRIFYHFFLTSSQPVRPPLERSLSKRVGKSRAAKNGRVAQRNDKG